MPTRASDPAVGWLPEGNQRVLRPSGNVPIDCALASIGFAVARLGVHDVVVLGHEGCGAVRAALGVVAVEEGDR